MASSDYYNKTVTITASDSLDLVEPTDAVYIGSTAGGATMTAVLESGQTQAFTVVAGSVLPIKVRRINSTGTLASAFVGLYAR